jgi:hypothetical protein
MTNKNKETSSKVTPEFKKTPYYSFPPQEELVRIRKKLTNSNYGGGNVAISEDAPVEEKMKYSVSQSILTHQRRSQKTFADLVKEIEIQNLTEKKLIDLCRGKITNFSLGELLIYANNLRITNIPCYHCGINLFPPLLGEILSSFKNQVSFCPQKVYREHVHHSSI